MYSAYRSKLRIPSSITILTGVIYSVICIAMTLKVELRIVLVFSMALMGLLFYVLTPFLMVNINNFLSRRLVLFGLILALTFFQGVFAAINNELMPFIFVLIGLFSVFSTLGLFVVMKLGSSEKFLFGFQFSMLIFGAVAVLLKLIFDYQILDNVNNYSALFIPCLCYLSFIKRYHFIAFVTLFAVVFLAIYFESRLALLLGLLVPILSFFSNRNFVRKLICWLALGATVGSVYVAVSFNPNINELLSNRVLIWQYYLFLSAQDIFMGFGFISADVAESTSNFVGYMVQRGVNEQYGTQSMVIRYIYENGIVVTIITYLFLFKQLLRNTRYANFAIVGYLPALLESMKIGVPSIYGCIFVVFFLMSLTEESIKV